MGAGGYDFVTRLGSGGMAEVFLARRRGLHGIEHTVVIKRLREDVRAIPAITKMFAWEAWISSRLCHPNIVMFHDFVSHRGREHIVLEHVRGPDISTIARALAAAGRVFPLRAVIDVGIAAARALEHAHGMTDDEGRIIGLVHRDVSPQNILVSIDGQIKLIDFGVAKTTSAHVPRETEPTLVKGKMGYIAPEHLRGQALDARSDVYGLGVVLFEMLTGRPLLRRGANAEMIRAALLSEVPMLTTLRPDCPSSLDTLVRRALAQDPSDRFDSAGAMENALRHVAASITEEVGTPTLIELARDVYAVHDPRRLPESVRRLPKISAAVPRVLDAPAKAITAEPETRPEGIVRRTTAVEPKPRADAILEVIDEPTTTLNCAQAPAPALLPRPAAPSRAKSIAFAFAIGVLAAFAVEEVARKIVMFSNDVKTGSATHGAPVFTGVPSAAEPASTR